MAELFIAPLVPLPITVSDFKLTKSPDEGFVLTSDAVGVASWAPANIAPQHSGSVQTTVTGPWASPQGINVSYSRWFNANGIRMSTVYFSAVGDVATVGTFATLTALIPALYRPLITVAASYPYANNSTFGAGIVSIDTNGQVLFASATNGNFVAAGNTGWYGFSMTYKSANID